MNKSQMPEITVPQINARFTTPAQATKQWQPLANMSDQQNVIEILDVIGDGGWFTEGISAKDVSNQLAQLDGADVKVRINSPGGDLFDGIAIYNLLRQHQGKVTVEIIGMAASAASVIACAGDEVLIGDGAMFMIHQAHGFVIGNATDMSKSAEDFKAFDASMAAIYSARTGIEQTKITDMMLAETYLTAQEAVEKGFATGFLQEQDTSRQAQNASARKIDAVLASIGMTRSERRSLMKEFKGMPSAATTDMPCAVEDTDALNKVLNNLK